MNPDGESHEPAELVPSPPTGSLSDVRRIGEGGSAEVFAAVWRGHEVAMKVAKPGAFEDERERERFLEEARRLARVRHPGIVEVLDTGALPDGRPYLVMPLLRGETLADRIARGPLGLAATLSIFTDLAEAVDALHDAGLIHRDLKPGNVFLPEGEARPILLDLGIAKELDATASTLTQAGVIRGTPAVMAPERFFGTPASVASDVYELAVVLYAMLVGRLPWENPTNVEARLFPRLPEELEVDVPERVVEALMSALSTRPERRPPSAGALAVLVASAADQAAHGEREPTQKVAARSEMPAPETPNAGTIPDRSPSWSTRRGRRASLAWLAVAVAGLGGLAAATVGSQILDGRHHGPASTGSAQLETSDESTPAATVTGDARAADPSSASASASAPALARSVHPPLPSASWALPRRTRHRELVWCNQIVDEVCDPVLIEANARAREACRQETERLERIQAGPRTAWAAAEKDCRDRHVAVQGVASLEKSGRRDEVVQLTREGMKAAASALPAPAADATLDAWLQRMPSCRAYVEFYCSERVRAYRGEYGCHAARNAAYVMARNAARYGPETIADHDRSCHRMLEQDRAAVLAEIKLTETLHPPAAASSAATPP